MSRPLKNLPVVLIEHIKQTVITLWFLSSTSYITYMSFMQRHSTNFLSPVDNKYTYITLANLHHPLNPDIYQGFLYMS